MLPCKPCALDHFASLGRDLGAFSQGMHVFFKGALPDVLVGIRVEWVSGCGRGGGGAGVGGETAERT